MMQEIFHYSKDADNIVTITMNMEGSVNTLNATFRNAMTQTVEKLEAEKLLAGVIITSAKRDFLAGGDPVSYTHLTLPTIAGV